jgi:4-hydroxybenzoate polyprenyltransferase
MRPKHWIKNLLVFAPIFFANQFSAVSLLQVTKVFLIFCLASSGSYLLNDVLDRKKDLFHPFKKDRPVASQELSIPAAITFSIIFQLSSFFLSFFILPKLALAVLSYLLVQVLYSTLLKKFPLIDVLWISSGYILRALAGAISAGVVLSSWLTLSVGILAVYLGFVRRRLELTGSYTLSYGTRETISHYSLDFLTLVERTCLACVLVIYVIWSVLGTDSDWMILTIPFVFFGIFRHQALTLQDNLTGESPDFVWAKDPAIVATIILWLISSFVALQF